MLFTILIFLCFFSANSNIFDCNLKYKFARVCHFYRYDERCFTGQTEFCQVLITKRDELKCPYFVCKSINEKNVSSSSFSNRSNVSEASSKTQNFELANSVKQVSHINKSEIKSLLQSKTVDKNVQNNSNLFLQQNKTSANSKFVQNQSFVRSDKNVKKNISFSSSQSTKSPKTFFKKSNSKLLTNKTTSARRPNSVLTSSKTENNFQVSYVNNSTSNVLHKNIPNLTNKTSSASLPNSVLTSSKTKNNFQVSYIKNSTSKVLHKNIPKLLAESKTKVNVTFFSKNVSSENDLKDKLVLESKNNSLTLQFLNKISNDSSNNQDIFLKTDNSQKKLNLLSKSKSIIDHSRQKQIFSSIHPLKANKTVDQLFKDDKPYWDEVSKLGNFTKFQTDLRQKVKNLTKELTFKKLNQTISEKMEIDCVDKTCTLEFREQPVVRLKFSFIFVFYHNT
jgi:hypothetical protein